MQAFHQPYSSLPSSFSSSPSSSSSSSSSSASLAPLYTEQTFSNQVERLLTLTMPATSFQLKATYHPHPHPRTPPTPTPTPILQTQPWAPPMSLITLTPPPTSGGSLPNEKRRGRTNSDLQLIGDAECAIKIYLEPSDERTDD